MTTIAQPSGRTYTLAPPDETGWMFGLNLTQLVICATATVGGVIIMSTISVPVGLAIIGIGVPLGVIRVADMTLPTAIPHAARWTKTALTGGAVWHQPLPFLGDKHERRIPGALGDHELLAITPTNTTRTAAGPRAKPIAVSHDLAANTYAATLRVTGTHFPLLDGDSQDQLISQWGTALQAFITEHTPVSSIRWSQWSGPADDRDHRAWLRDHLAADPLRNVAAAYAELLADAQATTTQHDVLVTLTVAANRAPRRKQSPDNNAAQCPAVEMLLSELRLFSQRLTAAGLTVSAPLGPTEWARTMQRRLDPISNNRSQTLAETVAQPDDAMPLATGKNWTNWHTDGAYHRALLITDWPRLQVSASWMGDLMRYTGATRTITVFYEPIPRSTSNRAITRDAAKIVSDADHRSENGFRVGAAHRRAAQAVEDREQELIAGYGECNYAGIITLTAATETELDDATDDVTQIAAGIGITVRPLHGRHDEAVCATLPIARGLAPTGTHR